MIGLLNENHTFCLCCASIDSLTEGRSSSCRVCGEPHEVNAFETLYSFSSDCVEYGVLYRYLYEKDRANGGVSARYALPLFDELLIFAGVSAASGIIGGIAYDIVKAAIKRIVASAPKDSKKERDPFFIQYLHSDENITAFINNISIYLQGLPGVDSSVTVAIMDEEITHEIQRILERQKRPLSTEVLADKKEMGKLHKKAIRNIREKYGLRPGKKQFKRVLEKLKTDI